MADMYLGNESGGFDLVGTTNIKNIDFEEAKISKEDYENLSEEERKTGIHLVTGLDDTENGGGSADLISYDNTNSGLGSTNVQGAIDELNSNLNNGVRFVNYSNPFKTFNTDGETWVATQDCCISGLIGNLAKNTAVIEIDGVKVAACAVASGAYSSTAGVNVYVKQGQTVSMRASASYQLSAYPLL